MMLEGRMVDSKIWIGGFQGFIFSYLAADIECYYYNSVAKGLPCCELRTITNHHIAYQFRY